MPTAHSTKPAKPAKPHKAFPLFAHASGQWAKKVLGTTHYFGSWGKGRAKSEQAELAELAEKRWDEQKADLKAGRKPRQKADSADGTTVKELVNQFLTSKELAVEAEDLSSRQFEDLKRAGKRVADKFGRSRVVADLRPDDFRELKAEMVTKYKSPISLRREMTNVRSIFKYGWENEYHGQVNFGSDFKLPSNKKVKSHKQKQKREHGDRCFTVEQIETLLDACTIPALRAMILLGLNIGTNNSDLRNMMFADIDIETGWLDYARIKTGEERRAKLWPETIAAINAYLKNRKEPPNEEHRKIVFLTKYRRPWGSDKSGDDPITKNFRKLLDSLDMHRPGLSFVSLRHTFRTVADSCKDPPAVDLVMGHADNTMAGNYRQSIEDARLEAVATHVHSWLFEGRSE